MKSLRQLRYAPLLLFALLACDDDDNKQSLTNSDKNFVQQTAISNMAEIELATLAATKATNQSVIDFAKHMISEHNEAQSDLKDIADDFENSDLPSSIDDAHAQKKQQLQNLSGMAFDSTYMRSQVNDHATVITLFQNEQINGSERRLKDYATKYLPHIQEHYNTAGNVLGQLKQNNND